MKLRGTTMGRVGLFVLIAVGLQVTSSRAIAECAPPDKPGSLSGDDQRPPGPLAGPRPPRGPDGQGPMDQEFGPNRHDRMRHRFGKGGDRAGLPAERIDQIMSILAEKLPDLHERLSKLREDDPDEFRRALRRLMPLFREYFGLLDHQPELADTVFEEFRIERELRELGRDYKQAEEANDSEAMSRIEPEIRQRVRHQLEMRIQRRQARLEDFRRRIAIQQKKLEEELAEHQDDMSRLDELTDRRVERIKQGKMRDFSRFRHRGHARPPGGEFGPPEGDGEPPRFGSGEGPPPGDRKFPRDRRHHRPPPPPPPDEGDAD